MTVQVSLRWNDQMLCIGHVFESNASDVLGRREESLFAAQHGLRACFERFRPVTMMMPPLDQREHVAPIIKELAPQARLMRVTRAIAEAQGYARECDPDYERDILVAFIAHEGIEALRTMLGVPDWTPPVGPERATA